MVCSDVQLNRCCVSCGCVLQRGHSGDVCLSASTLCRYVRRKGDLFVLSWARVRRMLRGRVSSVGLMSGGCACSVLFLSLFVRYLLTVAVCMVFMFVLMIAVVMLSGFVWMFVVYLVLLKVVCFLSLGVVLCLVSLCSGDAGCCDFCLICDACSLRCSCIGSICVSSCRCCVFVSSVHPVAVLSAAFCIFCSFCMFVADAVGDHMVEAYSSVGRITALYVARIVSFCLPHEVPESALIICNGLFAFVAMLSMCVLYVSLGSSVSPRIFGCVFMGSAVLFICSSMLHLYSAGSGVKRVHVVLSGLSMSSFSCVQLYISCRYGCMYALAAFLFECVDVMVMSSAYVMSCTGALGSGMSDV